MRKAIVKSSPTSTGGKVLEGVDTITIDGFGTTLIGMHASCPVCLKRVGNIVAKGPHQQFIMGIPIALEGDVVACGCPEGANVLMPLTKRVEVKIQSNQK